MSETILLDPLQVKPFADQPRKRFRGIKQLAESIRLVGQVTPIVVTACNEKGFVAELVDGERRLQACRSGGMKIKAVFEKGVPAEDRFALAIAANFCRQEHDCIEIAEAIRRLRDQGRSCEEIGGIFGKTSAWVSQHNTLLGLNSEVQAMLKRSGDEEKESRTKRRRRGRMTMHVALLLAPLDPDMQVKAAKHIAKKKIGKVAARNYVRHLAAGAGRTVGKKISPRAKLIRLLSAVDTFRHVIEPFTELAFADLSAIASQATAKEAITFAGKIGDLCAELIGLGDTFEARGKS